MATIAMIWETIQVAQVASEIVELKNKKVLEYNEKWYTDNLIKVTEIYEIDIWQGFEITKMQRFREVYVNTNNILYFY